MNIIEIYTDGACRNNQAKYNIGAYAYVISYLGVTKEFAGTRENTTNNIMELTAIYEALKQLKRFDLLIKVYSDSQYVVSGINDWRIGWEARNFKGVKNAQIWKQLFALLDKFKNIQVLKVAGHAGVYGNEKVDRLCNEAMDNKK